VSGSNPRAVVYLPVHNMLATKHDIGKYDDGPIRDIECEGLISYTKDD
jgi:hypothetical protein